MAGTWDWHAQAGRLWPILVDHAERRRTATYKEVGEQMGIYFRLLRHPLDLIGRHVRDAGLPPLTILVVSKASGRPGVGIVGTQAQDFEADLRRVYGYPWQNMRNPFAG